MILIDIKKATFKSGDEISEVTTGVTSGYQPHSISDADIEF